jgi:hypothetical protein
MNEPNNPDSTKRREEQLEEKLQDARKRFWELYGSDLRAPDKSGNGRTVLTWPKPQ